MFEEHPYYKLCAKLDDVVQKYNKLHINSYRFPAGYERTEKGDTTFSQHSPSRFIVRIPSPGFSAKDVVAKVFDSNKLNVIAKGHRLVGMELDTEFEKFRGFRVKDGVIELLIKYTLPASWNAITWEAWSEQLWEMETKV
jgi:hypothetical protein